MLIALQVIVGSFLWGGSKAKNSKRQEVIEAQTDLDHQATDNPLAMNSIPQNQNLTPTSSVGGWPASRALDMRNTHVDIDLMRG